MKLLRSPITKMSENTNHELGSGRPNHYTDNHSTSGSSIRNEEHTNISFKSQVHDQPRTSKELDKSSSRGGNNNVPLGNTKQHRRQHIYATWYDDSAEPIRDLTEDELLDAVLTEFTSSVNSAFLSAHVCSTSDLISQFEADLVQILISDELLNIIPNGYEIKSWFDWAAYIPGFLDLFSFKQQPLCLPLSRGILCCISQHRATGSNKS